MATLATTTLGAAVTAGGSLWPLASVTGVTIGSVLFADEEAAIVTGAPLGLSVPVQRGMLGSTVAAHGSGVTVYLGTQGQFYQQDPVGTPPATLETDPWINTVNGSIWTSSGGQWVIAGGGGGSFANPTITGTVTGGATYTAPTLTTPTLGVATATSVNKVAITAPAASATLTIANTKTLTVSNSITLAGTDATVMTFPATSASLARTDAANTFTGVQTMTSAALTTPELTGTVTGVYTLGGTPTLASAAGVPYAAGVAAGYVVARGVTALDGSNPTTIVTGLTTITGFAVALNRGTAVTTGTAFVTYDNIVGGSVDVFGWILAGTDSTGTEDVAWVAVGT